MNINFNYEFAKNKELTMNKNEGIKELVFSRILKILDERIESLKLAIEYAKESRDNETKCTVGDKYETGRAMMQMELDKNRVQLNKTENQKYELSKINFQKEYNKVEFGSLAETSQGNYFVTAAFGKIEIGERNYYCISLVSPIGKILSGKKQGARFIFQDKEFIIINIC